MEYIAYLHKTKASDFGVSFPDFRDVSPRENLWKKRGGLPPRR